MNQFNLRNKKHLLEELIKALTQVSTEIKNKFHNEVSGGVRPLFHPIGGTTIIMELYTNAIADDASITVDFSSQNYNYEVGSKLEPNTYISAGVSNHSGKALSDFTYNDPINRLSEEELKFLFKRISQFYLDQIPLIIKTLECQYGLKV